MHIKWQECRQNHQGGLVSSFGHHGQAFIFPHLGFREGSVYLWLIKKLVGTLAVELFFRMTNGTGREIPETKIYALNVNAVLEMAQRITLAIMLKVHLDRRSGVAICIQLVAANSGLNAVAVFR